MYRKSITKFLRAYFYGNKILWIILHVVNKLKDSVCVMAQKKVSDGFPTFKVTIEIAYVQENVLY